MNIKNKQEEFLNLYEPIARSLSAFARVLEKNEEAGMYLIVIKSDTGEQVVQRVIKR